MPNTLILILYPARNCIQKKWKISRNHWNFTCHYIDDSQLLQKNPLNVSSIFASNENQIFKIGVTFQKLHFNVKKKKRLDKASLEQDGFKGSCSKMVFLHFSQKETPTQVFSCGYCKICIFRNSFFYRTATVGASEERFFYPHDCIFKTKATEWNCFLADNLCQSLITADFMCYLFLSNTAS